MSRGGSYSGSRMPLECLPEEVVQGGGPGKDLGPTAGTMSTKRALTGKSGHLFSDCSLRDLTSNKENGAMDVSHYHNITQLYYHTYLWFSVYTDFEAF